MPLAENGKIDVCCYESYLPYTRKNIFKMSEYFLLRQNNCQFGGRVLNASHQNVANIEILNEISCNS